MYTIHLFLISLLVVFYLIKKDQILIHSVADGHLSCLSFGANANNVAVNILSHTFNKYVCLSIMYANISTYLWVEIFPQRLLVLLTLINNVTLISSMVSLVYTLISSL